MKRVLIIAYHFPPGGTGGVGRALGWVRHLPAYGWRTEVLASVPPPNWPTDHSLLAQVPGDVVVHRVGARDPRGAARRGIEHRELSFLWRRPAAQRAARIVEQFCPQVILATAPPPAAHAVAAAVARRYALPWVADFRDPWGVRAPALWRRWRRRVYVRGAAARVAVNERLRAHLESDLGAPVQTVFNGFEPDEIPGRQPSPDRQIAFLGTLSAFNPLDIFFGALAQVGGEFLHIGASRRYDLVGRARRAGLDRVTQTGYLTRAAALRRAASAWAYLAALTPDLELAVSAKIFDYIGLGGPVLCLDGGGALAEFVRGVSGLGCVVAADDRDSIVGALRALRAPPALLDREARERFARPRLAGEMAEILSRAAGGG